MKVLLVHNYYREAGGEDAVFEAECALLEAHGHSVIRYCKHNRTIEGAGSMLRLAAHAAWNPAVHRKLRTLARSERPDVAHFHNTFPLISPSAYYALAEARIPIVQTLHNFRFSCLIGILYRNEQICEECVGRRLPWPGVIHGCYHGSVIGSGAVAAAHLVHHSLGSWVDKTARCIVMTEFGRQRCIQSGFPPERLCIKPHFVPFDGGAASDDEGFVLFVGRLSSEKGVRTLLKAWEQGEAGRIPLRIVGAGALAEDVKRAAARCPTIEYLGRKTSAEVLALIGRAAFVIIPSECYETFGLVAIEAFSRGTPVVASARGGLVELVEHGRTGLCFRPGDPTDLAEKAAALYYVQQLRRAMRPACRAEYEGKYTPARSYAMLMNIYQTMLDSR